MSRYTRHHRTSREVKKESSTASEHTQTNLQPYKQTGLGVLLDSSSKLFDRSLPSLFVYLFIVSHLLQHLRQLELLQQSQFRHRVCHFLPEEACVPCGGGGGWGGGGGGVRM